MTNKKVVLVGGGTGLSTMKHIHSIVSGTSVDVIIVGGGYQPSYSYVYEKPIVYAPYLPKLPYYYAEHREDNYPSPYNIGPRPYRVGGGKSKRVW